MLEVSAGGVVIHNGEFLLLKKFSNDWVLPKGRLENNETIELAAIREVQEESGISAKIEKYLGFVKYDYQHNDGEKVKKTVHYFYMEPEDLNLIPQREEGFVEAIFLPYDKAGGYGIQDNGNFLIKSTKGDFYNIVGLPISKLHRKIKDVY